MSLRTSANRYAKALFDVALQEKADLAQVDRDLAGRGRDDAGEPGAGRGRRTAARSPTRRASR